MGGNRNQEPPISPLSDFDKLLTYLFSEANQTYASYVAEVEKEGGVVLSALREQLPKIES